MTEEQSAFNVKPPPGKPGRVFVTLQNLDADQLPLLVELGRDVGTELDAPRLWLVRDGEVENVALLEVRQVCLTHT